MAQSLFFETENLMQVFDSLLEGVYILDKERKIIYWNAAAEKISGYSKEEVVNRHCYDNILQHINGLGTKVCFAGCPLHGTIQDGQHRSGKVYLHHKNGYRVAVNLKTIPLLKNGEIIGGIEIFSDQSHDTTIQENLDELKEIAFNDALTSIYNRRYMEVYLEYKLQEYNSFSIPFSVIFFDIDDFKLINDQYGHLAGDEVLKMIALSAQSVIRKTDVLGRWGGEEFVIILPGVESYNLLKISENLRKIIEKSNVTYNDILIEATVSVGATTINEIDTPDSIIERVDKLMYQSKKEGKNKSTIG